MRTVLLVLAVLFFAAFTAIAGGVVDTNDVNTALLQGLGLTSFASSFLVRD